MIFQSERVKQVMPQKPKEPRPLFRPSQSAFVFWFIECTELSRALPSSFRCMNEDWVG